MNRQRLIILITAALGMSATFLPWITMPFDQDGYSENITIMRGSDILFGWLTFSLYAISLIFGILKEKQKPLNGTALYKAIVPSILASLIGVFFKPIFFQENEGVLGVINIVGSIGYGLWLVIVLGVLQAFLAYRLRNPE